MAGGSRATRLAAGGFTMVEVLVASVVLSVVVVALTQAVVAGQAQAVDAVHDSRATTLAQTLLEEILARPMVDPQGDAPPGGNNRQLFDSIDDFAGYAQAPDAMTDLAGELLPGPYQGFGWSVGVTPEAMTLGGASSVDGSRVTVTVVDRNGRTWTVARWVPQGYGE